MPIKGLTDKKRPGRLPIIGTIAKGKEDNNRLSVLPSFAFNTPQVEHLEGVLGKSPDTIAIEFPRVMFWQVNAADMDACIDLVLDTQLERRRGRRVVCAGDGERITKHIQEHDNTAPGSEWPDVIDGVTEEGEVLPCSLWDCPYRQRIPNGNDDTKPAPCQPHGYLRFAVRGVDHAVGYYQTSVSKTAIEPLAEQLRIIWQEYQRIWDIPLILRWELVKRKYPRRTTTFRNLRLGIDPAFKQHIDDLRSQTVEELAAGLFGEDEPSADEEPEAPAVEQADPPRPTVQPEPEPDDHPKTEDAPEQIQLPSEMHTWREFVDAVLQEIPFYETEPDIVAALLPHFPDGKLQGPGGVLIPVWGHAYNALLDHAMTEVDA